MSLPVHRMSQDLLAIGEPLVEFNQVRPGAVDWRQGFGGDTSNLAVAAARFGARVGYVSRVGDDLFGRMLRDLWMAEGVECADVRVDPDAPTGLYFVTHGPDGHAFTYRRAGSAASRLGVSDLVPDRLRSARVVHTSAITLAISPTAREAGLAALDMARRSGVATSFDPNLRLRLWSLDAAREAIREAARGVAYFFPSLDDARVLAGTERIDGLIDWAHGLGAGWVFLKRGAGGVVVSDGRERREWAGHAVAAVDATGAGDCFAGVTLARILAGDDPWEAARVGNAAAALSTTGLGAVDPLPRPGDVEALLRG